MSKPAVFIDRDGTISDEVGYVNHLTRFRLLPNSAAAVRILNERDWLTVVITNQSGVARGYFTEELVQQINARMLQELSEAGARVDGVYYCPHHPTTGLAQYVLDCDCRKPRPGLVQRAARDLDIDLSRSWMIGDRKGDVGLAHAAGMKGVLVLTGYGRGEFEYEMKKWEHQPDLVAEDLLDAVKRIVN